MTVVASGAVVVGADCRVASADGWGAEHGATTASDGATGAARAENTAGEVGVLQTAAPVSSTF